jgi:nicotinate phosphoribosyltransferase
MRQFLQPSPLLTDLYQLTMLQGYLEHGFTENADFEFFVRDLPKNRNFLIAAGLEEVLDYLTNLKFSAKELDWLSKQKRFNKDFISYLENFKFEGDIHAMPEGTIFFPDEPILRVSAPIPQAQLIETRIINLLHYQTMIASKAIRSVIAASGKVIVDFGLRRAHGAEAGLFAARSSYLAGFSGTSTVLAGELYNIPLYGTMAHSFIQAHDDEISAFENFAESQPDNVVLLVDTYDIFQAIDKVIKLAKKLEKRNRQIEAVRLDSGDLIDNSHKIREILDNAEMSHIKIFASGNLDEYALQKFNNAEAPIDGFGVGTLMVTSSDAPYLECGYKLVQFAGQARYKRSPKKETWPCPKQVYRYLDKNSNYSYDEITMESENRDGIPLLKRVIKDGKRIQPEKSVSVIRDYVKSQLDQLPRNLLNLNKKSNYSVKISDSFKKYTNGVQS